MYRLKQQLVVSTLLMFMYSTSLVAGNVDLLNIEKTPSGTILSENLVVKSNANGSKYLTATNNTGEGKLITPVKIFSENGFEITLKISVVTDSLRQQEEVIYLIPNESNKSSIRMSLSSTGLSLKVQGYESGYVSFDNLNWNKNSTNIFKLSLLGNTLRVHVNDVLSLNVDSNDISVSYDQLQFTKINSDTQIYELKVGGYVLSGDCIAEYTVDGRLHIPCVRVPASQGVIYDVWMQQHPNVFTFDLDTNTIQTR